MKIKKNGLYIQIEHDTGDEWDEIFALECVCGHTLQEHYYNYLPRTEKFIETGKCKKSSHCSQFKMTGKVESVGNYGYIYQQ